eukprot:2416783-Alexandrium_andersonii.AAC.1
MSASLVGSEMCIRDRSSDRGLPQLTPRVARDAPAKCTSSPALVRVLAVSYTHLTLPTICSV